MSKVYCGSKSKAPKGRRFGTASECADTKQLRRYGRYRTDERVLNKKPGKSKRQTLNELMAENAKLTGRIGRLKKEFGRAKLSEKRREEIRKEHAKAVVQRRLVVKKIRNIRS